ncbi:MAG: chromosomal replication initiator protein DnaA [Chitinivibrionales bacterium]|nr:chromosomal replication initiator protein DnaA [Chitinivibrionales bacterium]
MENGLWQKISSDCARSMDANTFETWIQPLVPAASTRPALLTLQAPNQFVCDFLDSNYKRNLLALAKQHDPSIEDIQFFPGAPAAISEKNIPPAASHSNPSAAFQENNAYAPILNKRFTFDTFVVGAGNEFAKSAAFAVSEAPGKTKFNPLLIYGGVGLGKTHLLHAIGNYSLSLSPKNRICYITSEEFYLNFIDAIKNNSTKKFTAVFRNADFLLMDDIQFLAGKESTQEEFFFIFNTLYQNGRQIVLTSDLPPNQIKGLHDRLVSRFQWGLCVDIQPPDLETRVAILKRKTEEDNIIIAENILYYLAENIPSNIRELEGAVIRLLAFASITKCDIDLDLVKNVLNESLRKENKKISIDDIIDKVATHFNVPLDTIREKNRRKEVVLCRQIAMYITKSITNYSLKTIGLHFGGRDHATVIHAVHQIEKLKQKDQGILNDINYIISALK